MRLRLKFLLLASALMGFFPTAVHAQFRDNGVVKDMRFTRNGIQYLANAFVAERNGGSCSMVGTLTIKNELVKSDDDSYLEKCQAHQKLQRSLPIPQPFLNPSDFPEVWIDHNTKYSHAAVLNKEQVQCMQDAMSEMTTAVQARDKLLKIYSAPAVHMELHDQGEARAWDREWIKPGVQQAIHPLKVIVVRNPQGRCIYKKQNELVAEIDQWLNKQPGYRRAEAESAPEPVIAPAPAAAGERAN